MKKHSGIEIYPAYARSDADVEDGLYVETCSNMWNANCLVAYFFDPPGDDTRDAILSVPHTQEIEEDMFILWVPLKSKSISTPHYRKEVKHVPIYPFPKFSIAVKPSAEFIKSNPDIGDGIINVGSSAALRDYVKRGLMTVCGISQIVPLGSRQEILAFVSPTPEDSLDRAWGGKMCAFRQKTYDFRDIIPNDVSFVHVTNYTDEYVVAFINAAYSGRNVK